MTTLYTTPEQDKARFEHLAREAPSAGVLFDAPPPPPQRIDGARSTIHTAALSHSGAMRRATLDRQIARRGVRTAWLKHDDPADLSNLILCATPLIVPVPFDDHCVLTAFERDLDRVESKFRAGRKDKSIGGELGSIIIKKKIPKTRKLPPRQSDLQSNGSAKRPLPFNVNADRNAKRLKEMEKPNKPIDHTIHYRNAIKTSEIAKMAKARSSSLGGQLRVARAIAGACAREARKTAFRSVRVIDEAHRRARRILKDVLSYWKKEDKERQEERKKLMARAEEHRKREADRREAQRQKNKLKYLLGQSEVFSQFLKAKTKATALADGQSIADMASKANGVTDISGITGAEDEKQIKNIAAAKAAQLVAAHQARIRQFDIETQKKKTLSIEASEKAAANRAAARENVDLNGITNEERDAMLVEDEERTQKANQPQEAPMANGTEELTRMAGSEKPDVAPVRQPSILNCKMKDYQLRGLAWLVSLYDQGINGILADEMGLGKTLQTISFLAYLCEKENNWGPFLVVSPKATLHNWQQEVTRFCPALKVLPYWGNKNDRNELRKYWSAKRMYRRDSEFQICITSYEVLTVDEKYFNRVKWQYLVLDEAQAIKNSSSSRWKALLSFPCRNRLLLTGTPLQNKLAELWSLLHFIMPTIFDSHAEFADWFAKDIEGHAQNNKILDSQTLARLRTLLDPFMLRRVKRDVESEMPPKIEVQLPCMLSARQRQLYASIKANISPEELAGAAGPNGGPGGQDISDRNSKLMNLVMQLRKVCNHPETFERRVPQSPYQFQATPPPSHVAPPPSVLVASNVAVVAQDITLVSRSQIVLNAPRLVQDIEYDRAYKQHLLQERLGAWKRERMRDAFYLEDSEMAIIRLCGGVSVSEANDIMLRGSAPWEWGKFGVEVDDQLLGLEEMYLPGKDEYEKCDAGYREALARPHRLLLEPRAETLRRRRHQVVMPSHGSPAEIVATKTRMLKSARVYIPKAAAPVPDLYYPGETALAGRLCVDEALPYPGFPRAGDVWNADMVYKVYRSLDAEYGAHVGTPPIQMPEAGRLIADCGKMTVLDPLLRRLKTEGHKCLIYSQFTRVLDILEDYCGKTGFKFVRLDGQSALADRRDIVAEWQTNEELFIFLLSTRAGGVGLNLTAADTVIFFDSDWNPTQDLQAMDRAHRLGQERPVTVYRLISRGTIEERMLIRAQQKSRINDLVIKGGGLNTEVEGAKDAEIDDIAALLMGEEDFSAKVDSDMVLEKARRSVELFKRIGNGIKVPLVQ